MIYFLQDSTRNAHFGSFSSDIIHIYGHDPILEGVTKENVTLNWERISVVPGDLSVGLPQLTFCRTEATGP